MSSESDSKEVEWETKIHHYSRDREEKENTIIPSSSEHTPLHLKIKAEGETHAVINTGMEIDMDGFDSIPGIPVLATNVEYLEKKPWRKAGVDISDYFNYGFDEESWAAYCKKQAQLCAANRKLYTKSRVQKGHTRHREKEPCCAYSSSGHSSILPSRESSATTEVTGSSSRVEGRHCLSDEGNNTEVVTEMSPREDRFTSNHLTTPSTFSPLFAYTSGTPLPYRPGPPPFSHTAILDSGYDKETDDDPSTSLYPCSSGVSSLIPKSMVSTDGVINTAKARERYIWQEECDKGRDRSREYGHDKDSKKGRDRENERYSSSHNRGEERMRHRYTMERGHKEELTERRRKREGWQKSPRSSSGSRDDGEDRESWSRHTHKKAKRNRKDKETDKMLSADQERKLKSE